MPKKTPPTIRDVIYAELRSGLNISELSRASGVAISSLFAAKSGDRGLGIDAIERIAVVLGYELRKSPEVSSSENTGENRNPK